MPQVPRFGISDMPVSRELTPAGTSAHSRQTVKVDRFRVANGPDSEAELCCDRPPGDGGH